MIVMHYGFNERADLTKAHQFNTEQEVKDFLKLKFSNAFSFGIDTLTKNGCYREAAIEYDFLPWLTKYLVEYYETGKLISAWAPNKTALRKAINLSRNDRVLVYPKA